MKVKPFTILAACAVPLLLAACGSADVVPHETPAPPVTSVAQADGQLAAVARERAAIEARFAERRQVCYEKFFVNNCLDEAKERHRSALAAQRAIEVQAERFKRQTIADERDRQVAESEQRFREQEAKLAAEPPKPPPQVAPLPPPKPSAAGRAAAQRDARLRADAKQEAQDADKRAQNVRDYEKRKAESEARQRRVAERKAQRAAKAVQQNAASPAQR